MTALELAREVAKVADGFRGRFFYDGERGDLAYIAVECEAKECECAPSYNADGDIDCSTSVGTLDGIDDVAEPIAQMLNAVGPLALEVLSLHAECERMQAVCEVAQKWRANEVLVGQFSPFDDSPSAIAARQAEWRLTDELRDALDASAKEK